VGAACAGDAFLLNRGESIVTEAFGLDTLVDVRADIVVVHVENPRGIPVDFVHPPRPHGTPRRCAREPGSSATPLIDEDDNLAAARMTMQARPATSSTRNGSRHTVALRKDACRERGAGRFTGGGQRLAPVA
jgi:hypothetical protein